MIFVRSSRNMEQVKCITTPNKMQNGDNSLVNNRLYNASVKQNEHKCKHITYQYNVGHFAVLPSHITPPSGLRKFNGKNPFEADLTNRLHLSTISPTVFTKVPNSSQHSPAFTWSIDDIALMQPAKIEEFPIQQIYSPDPEIEVKAQAAIDRFFNQNQIIPSPLEVIKRKEESVSNMDVDTPYRSRNDLNSVKELSKSRKDAWAQTVLSLPLDLPQGVEEALKPFFTFTQEQNLDNDDVNLSNSSLRRKLFFNHDEGADNENESFMSLSPVKLTESMVLSCSPPQNGIFIHGTPLKASLQQNERSFVTSENLSSPNISPICENKDDIYSKNIGYSARAQLDFVADINISREKGCNSDDDHLLDMFRYENNIKSVGNDRKLKIVNNCKTNLCNSVDTKISRFTVPVDNTIYSDVSNIKVHNGTNLKILTEVTKNSTYDKQSIISGAFDSGSIFNSIQDTGYETYGVSSTMHTPVSYDNTSLNHKVYWNEHITTFKDDQSPWKNNMKNVFSSTPSKRNIEKES